MRKFLALATGVLMAQVTVAQGAKEGTAANFYAEEVASITPTYLDNVFAGRGWKDNWFITVQGGVSAFAGKPVGHGDLFNRLKPTVHIAAGKWVSPTVGLRLACLSGNFKDGNMINRSFLNLHGDVMYNISNALREEHETLYKVDVMPYVGLGIIRNRDAATKPFAATLGLQVRYRLLERLHVSAEISNTFTHEQFDGIGENRFFGDNMLQATVGLTMTVGKVGWKRVIDPVPYVFQNGELIQRLESANSKINTLRKQKERDAAALAEMRKILEIEGLLDKYELEIPQGDEEVKSYPKNNYSGLNSLRARLKNKKSTTEVAEKEYLPNAWNPNDTTVVTAKEYFTLMKDGKIFVGTPVFFFFKLRSADLYEKAQMINIREIASVIKKYGLAARVVGAADSQTGTAYINEKLSEKRAGYIARLLKEQGVPEERVEIQYRGGINQYIPTEGNRNTCVLLYFK